MSYKIEWVGEARPELEKDLREEIERRFTAQGKLVQNIIKHDYFLSESYEGPSITVTWDAGKNALVAAYSKVTLWKSLTVAEIEAGASW